LGKSHQNQDIESRLRELTERTRRTRRELEELIRQADPDRTRAQADDKPIMFRRRRREA
jgi:Spy/CpxP family protein refolding chaperone